MPLGNRCRRLHTLKLAMAAKQYREDGFCFPLKLFPDQDFDFLPRYKEFRKTCLQQKKWSEYRFKSHLLLPWLYDLLVNNKQLQEAARSLLQTNDVVIWSTDWCVKPGRSLDHFTWHQDSTYSKLDGATVWLAFSEVKASSGPLLFRKSSHRFGQVPHVESEDESNLLAFGQYIPESQNAWCSLPVVTAELQPGEASAHSFFTIHRSASNEDSEDRVGLAIRIVAASSGLTRHDRVTRLSGNGTLHGFEEECPPETEFGTKELHEWQSSMEREKAMYFESSLRSSYK